MNKIKVVFGYLILFFFIGITTASTPGEINSCQELNVSGDYWLNSDLSHTGTGICIEITASNINLNCQGHTITGDKTAGSYGIMFNSYDSSSLKNCNINNFSTGLHLYGTIKNNLTNINVTNSSVHNVYFEGSPSNNLTDIRIFNSSQYGLRLYNSDNNNFNNIFSSQNNYGIFFNSGSNYNNFTNINSINNIDSDFNLQGTSNNFYDVNFSDRNSKCYTSQNLYGISSTATISQCGIYAMCGVNYSVIQDVSHTGAGKCIELFKNSHIDCQGHTITGDKTAGSYGIMFNSYDSSSLKNCNINNFSTGLHLYGTIKNNLTNINVTNSSVHNVYLEGSPSNNLTYIKIFNSSQYGLRLHNSNNNNFDNSIIKNNNGHNVYLEGSSVNNIFYGNNFGNSSKIQGSSTNFFTSQGSIKIGNYYDEINCVTNTTREFQGANYSICTNPSSFVVNGITDSAPLASPNIITFSPPTPPSSESGSQNSNDFTSIFPANSFISQLIGIFIIIGFLFI